MALESLEERKPEEEALAEEKGEKGGKGSFEKDQSVTKRWSRGSAEKKEKDPFTPVSNQPTREWKSLERYSVPETRRSSGTKPLSIERVLVFGSIGLVGGVLAVWKEGPLIHTGACIASLLGQVEESTHVARLLYFCCCGVYRNGVVQKWKV